MISPPLIPFSFYVTSVLILSGEKAHSRAWGGLPSQGKAFARTWIREFANPNGRNPDSSPDEPPTRAKNLFLQQKGFTKPQRIFCRRKSLRVGGREKRFLMRPSSASTNDTPWYKSNLIRAYGHSRPLDRRGGCVTPQLYPTGTGSQRVDLYEHHDEPIYYIVGPISGNASFLQKPLIFNNFQHFCDFDHSYGSWWYRTDQIKSNFLKFSFSTFLKHLRNVRFRGGKHSRATLDGYTRRDRTTRFHEILKKVYIF